MPRIRSSPRARAEERVFPLLAACSVLCCSIYAAPDGPLDPDGGGSGNNAGSQSVAGANGGGHGGSGAESGSGAGGSATAGTESTGGAAGTGSQTGGSAGSAGTAGSDAAGGSAGSSGSDAGGSGGSEVIGGGSGTGGTETSGGSGGSGGSGATAELALDKPATASSDQTAHSIAHGNDGDFGTRWCAAVGDFPQFWRADLGAVHELASFEVTWEFGNRAYSYEVATSEDDVTYDVKITRTQSGQVQSGFFPAQTFGRYLKITVTGAPGNTWASFYELKVFGN